MAHGTPESVDQMADYLRLVRGGREPSAELIEEMTHNWEAIGGRSPLTDITLQQGDALRTQLAADGLTFPLSWVCAIGDRSSPTRCVRSNGSEPGASWAFRMAPQFSTLSVQKYIDAATSALPQGIEFSCVRSFHDHPLLIEAFAEKVRAERPRPDEDIVFTAHSLPERVAAAGDPYPDQVAATAKAIADRCGIRSYHTAYQSAGRTPEPWLGPDLSEHVRLRAASGVRSILVVPVGFVCDHTEILFDVDVQAAAAAREAGVALRRTQSLNTSPTFIRTLAELVQSSVGSQQSAVASHSRQTTVDS